MTAKTKKTTLKNDNKDNKEISTEIAFDKIEVRNGSFIFGFKSDSFAYECTFKKDLKGIASEKWLIDGKATKVGIKKGCELLKLSEETVSLVKAKRLSTLRAIRGDDSGIEKVEFEIKELESKKEALAAKMLKLDKKIDEARVQLEMANSAEKENNIDSKELLAQAKAERVKALEAELESMKS